MFAEMHTNADLFGAIVGQCCVCGLAFAGLRRAWGRLTLGTLDVLGVLTLGSLLAYVVWMWDEVWVARWLPVSNLIILGNAFPLLTTILAVNVSRRSNLAIWRRGCALSILGVTGVLACLWPLLGRTPACGNLWLADGTCLQTTPYTCSAACAATLLRRHGISATEQEMAELCLTRHGTTWMGLYRGLKKKTAGTAWDVEVVECSAAELQAHEKAPCILRVGMPSDSPFDTDLTLEMGWRPGLRHSVVWEGLTANGMVSIADPTPEIGHEVWSTDEFAQFYQGQLVRLVPRAP